MKKKQALHVRACDLLGVDPLKVRRVGPSEFKELTGHSIGRARGKASRNHPLIYVRRGQGIDTYIHELLHILFPSRPHWWIFGAAFKIADVSGRHWAYGRWQSKDAVAESRAKLIELARRSASRRGLSAGERNEDTKEL